MRAILKFLICAYICSVTYANLSQKSKDDETSKKSETSSLDQNKLREKRQLTYIPTTVPVFLDSPQQPGLLGLGGTIPVFGNLLGGLPGLLGNQNLLAGLPGQLGGLTGGLTSSLGNLGGGLGNLGQLGNIGGLGNLGLLGGSAPSATNAASCPAAQKLACRCEPLIPIKPLGTRTDFSNEAIEILSQNIKKRLDGSTEMVVHLSNGVTLYQKSRNQISSKDIEGYYSVKVTEDRYLTIYYTINDLDYSVKADVHSEPPKTHLGLENDQHNLLRSFQ